MFGLNSPLHWLIVLLIVVFVFGTKKIRNIGADLGGAVKDFKDAMKGERALGNQEPASGGALENEANNKPKP